VWTVFLESGLATAAHAKAHRKQAKRLAKKHSANVADAVDACSCAFLLIFVLSQAAAKASFLQAWGQWAWFYSESFGFFLSHLVAMLLPCFFFTWTPTERPGRPYRSHAFAAARTDHSGPRASVVHQRTQGLFV
jgi:hypothetical protein